MKTVPEDIFVYNTKVTNVASMFQDCRNIQGTAPELWDSTKYPYVTTYDKCFRNCTKLTNYADIPDDWK